jgi:hypothetical protein
MIGQEANHPISEGDAVSRPRRDATSRASPTIPARSRAPATASCARCCSKPRSAWPFAAPGHRP